MSKLKLHSEQPSESVWFKFVREKYKMLGDWIIWHDEPPWHYTTHPEPKEPA